MRIIMNNFSQQPIKYDSKWPEYFLELSEQIKSALGENLVGIHHIGSTAIPGLMAKPIIDMLGEAKNINQIGEAKTRMEALGFEFKGEYGIPERAYFSKKSDTAIHLHIFPKDHYQLEKHLIFRDYLLEHPAALNAYQAKKEELLAAFPGDRQAYQQGKNVLILEITKAAYKWKGKNPPEFL